jgi:probable F420-dependent oxidoreductase
VDAARPIRFGTSAGRTDDPARLRTLARRAEGLGYSTFGLADHFMIPFAPLIAGQAVADATTTIRVGQVVMASDFRHPAVLAKELASLDVLSGGRLEIGIGAGWMREEFDAAGIVFDAASVRIARLEEAITVLKGLFADEPCTFAGEYFTITALDGLPKPVQRPHPPIMIGGGGHKVLSVAARHADIIQVLPGVIRGVAALDASQFAPRSYREKVDWIRGAAGPRFDAIELGTLLMHVSITEDAERARDEFLAQFPADAVADDATRAELLASPVVAIGSLDEVCDRLLATRDDFGFSYFAPPLGGDPDAFALLVERLTGR